MWKDPERADWHRVSYLNNVRTYYFNDGTVESYDKEGNQVSEPQKRTQLFHSYFDTSLGEEIWRSEQFKDAERSGKIMMHHTEAERIARDAKSKAEAEHRARTQINNRELMEKIRYASGGDFKIVK